MSIDICGFNAYLVVLHACLSFLIHSEVHFCSGCTKIARLILSKL